MGHVFGLQVKEYHPVDQRHRIYLIVVLPDLFLVSCRTLVQFHLGTRLTFDAEVIIAEFTTFCIDQHLSNIVSTVKSIRTSRTEIINDVFFSSQTKHSTSVLEEDRIDRGEDSLEYSSSRRRRFYRVLPVLFITIESFFFRIISLMHTIQTAGMQFFFHLSLDMRSFRPERRPSRANALDQHTFV
jgi:hypothetical protein